MTVRVREKKETNELWILHCRLSTQEPAKENGVSDRVRVGTKKDTMVAKLEERTHGTGQWQERKQRAGEKWQGRNQSMLDVWQDRLNCSVVSKRRQHKFVRH